jgi:hypothetical protein
MANRPAARALSTRRCSSSTAVAIERVHQPDELQLGEELAGARLVDRLALEVLELHRQRQVVVERDQLAAEPDGVEAGHEVLAQLRLLHLGRMGQHAVQRAVLL